MSESATSPRPRGCLSWAFRRLGEGAASFVLLFVGVGLNPADERVPALAHALIFKSGFVMTVTVWAWLWLLILVVRKLLRPVGAGRVTSSVVVDLVRVQAAMLALICTATFLSTFAALAGSMERPRAYYLEFSEALQLIHVFAVGYVVLALAICAALRKIQFRMSILDGMLLTALLADAILLERVIRMLVQS